MAKAIVRHVSPPRSLHDASSNNMCVPCGGRGFFRRGYVNDDPVKPIIEICRDCKGYGEHRSLITVSRVLIALALLTTFIAFVAVPAIRFLIR